MVIGHTTSGAEALAAKVPGAHVVSTFSTVPSELQYSSDAKGTPPDVIYCGDNEGAKKTTAGLIRDASLTRGMDTRRLSTARNVEPFSLLVAQLPTTARTTRHYNDAADTTGTRTSYSNAIESAPSRVADVKSRYRSR